MSGSRFFEGMLLGGALGYLFGILSAPKSGADLRKQLADNSEDLYKQAGDQLAELKGKTDQAVHDLQAKSGEVLKKASASVKETKEHLSSRLDELAGQGTKVLTEEPESRL